MLEKLTITNFQSFRNVTYEFSDGLNVIIAPNNTGKSIIFKVIDVLVNGHKMSSAERKEFIRFGCNKSDVYVKSGGNYYWAEILPRHTNYYSGSSMNSMTFLSNELPNEIRQAFALLVCEDGLIGNVIDSNQSKFLIDSDSRVNNSILGLLTRDSNAEKIIETTTERIKTLNAEVRIKNSERKIYARELESIGVTDISYRQNIVIDSNVLLTLADILLPVKEKLDTIKQVKQVDSSFKPIMDVVTQLESIKYKLSEIRNVEVFPVDKSYIDFICKLESVSERLRHVNDIKLPNKDILDFSVKLENIREKISGVNHINLPSEVEVEAYNKLSQIMKKTQQILTLMRENKVLDIESKRIKNQLNDLRGEVHDCPIHGTIKLVNEECIPYSNRLS